VENTQESVNPYVVDEPAVEETKFFGREKELQWAAEVLGTRGVRRVVVVLGSHRIGKTSFVHQLGRRLRQKMLVVDLSAEQEVRLGHLLWRAATTIAADVRRETGRSFPDPEINEFLTDAGFFHHDFLPRVYAALKRKRLVLACDGLETLKGGEGGLREGFFSYLSSLMDSGLNLSLLLSVEEWPEQVAALFGDVQCLRLGPLEDAAATDLVLQPARGMLEFDYEAVRRILDLSCGHPYFVQLLCHAVFERCVVDGRATQKDVEAIVEGVLEAASPYMEHILNGASARARTALIALASLRGVHGILLEQDLRYALRRTGTTMSASEIRQACEELVDRDVLEALGAMSYQFRVELVRMWLSARRGLGPRLGTRGTSKVAAAAGDWMGRFLWPLIGMLALTAVALLCLLSWPTLRGGGEASATPVETSDSSALSYALITPTPDLRLTATPVPTPRPPALDIAYVQWDEASESWDIFAMSRDGTLVERLTDNEVDDNSPVWAPDHSWLTFVSRRDGNLEIYRADGDGSNPVNLTDNPAADWTPSISPDGTKVVFSSLRDGNWELYMMNADGSQPARMTFNQEPDYSPAWSPDGSTIAFVSERDGNLEIYLMNADGSQESRLTFDDDLDLAPAWSPDGSSIAFESYRDGNMEIFVMNADGAEQRNLTNYPQADDHGPSWSDDGLGILFYSNRDGNWDLFMMNAQGGEARNLTSSPTLEQEPYWSS
jgi:hypothetical protein